jgi:hypothetical protein
MDNPNPAPAMGEADRPHVDPTAVLAGERATLDRGTEPRTRKLIANDGTEHEFTDPEAIIPPAELEQRTARLDGAEQWATVQGDRLLVEQITRMAAERAYLEAEVQALATALVDYVPPPGSDELGSLGELTAQQYREGFVQLLQRFQTLRQRQRALRGQVEEFTRRRQRGGKAVYMEALRQQPEMATVFVDMVQGYEGFEVEPFTPQFQDVDPDDLEPDFDKAIRRINRGDEVHARLVQRDVLRGIINAPTADELRRYPALRLKFPS